MINGGVINVVVSIGKVGVIKQGVLLVLCRTFFIFRQKVATLQSLEKTRVNFGNLLAE